MIECIMNKQILGTASIHVQISNVHHLQSAAWARLLKKLHLTSVALVSIMRTMQDRAQITINNGVNYRVKVHSMYNKHCHLGDFQ